jgi:hypothetical protein
MEKEEMILSEDREIRKIITEELGISEEVRRLSDDLCRSIIEQYDGSGRFITSFIFHEKEWVVRLSFADYPKLSLCPGGGDVPYKGITYFDYKTIMVEGFTVRGKIPKEKLGEVMQHELQHVFELFMVKKDGFFDSKTKQDTYIIGAKQATNAGLPKIQRHIGYAVYLWHDFESRAFENGTYSYIMSSSLNFPGDEFEAAKKSSYYRRIMWVREACSFVAEHREEATKIAETVYGKTYNWLRRTVEYSLKECRRQFGRAVAKAGKDYDWTHGGKTLVSV